MLYPACRRRCSKNGVYIHLSSPLHLRICFTMYLLLLLLLVLLVLLLHKETYHGLRHHGRAPIHGLGVCLTMQETRGDRQQETCKKMIQTERPRDRQTDRHRDRDSRETAIPTLELLFLQESHEFFLKPGVLDGIPL